MVVAEHPDLVVLDAGLAGDPWYVLEFIKSNDLNTPCLFCAHTSMDVSKAETLGADEILMDGFSSQDLIDVIQQLY